jgi:hypothetical protein
MTADGALEIAREAYIYPMVLLQMSRNVSTNVSEPTGLMAPINQFAHGREFPDPSFTIVVRPNADTLYTSLNYDVSAEPLIITAGIRTVAIICSRFWTTGPTFSRFPASARQGPDRSPSPSSDPNGAERCRPGSWNTVVRRRSAGWAGVCRRMGRGTMSGP